MTIDLGGTAERTAWHLHVVGLESEAAKENMLQQCKKASEQAQLNMRASTAQTGQSFQLKTLISSIPDLLGALQFPRTTLLHTSPKKHILAGT